MLAKNVSEKLPIGVADVTKPGGAVNPGGVPKPGVGTPPDIGAGSTSAPRRVWNGAMEGSAWSNSWYWDDTLLERLSTMVRVTKTIPRRMISTVEVTISSTRVN